MSHRHMGAGSLGNKFKQKSHRASCICSTRETTSLPKSWRTHLLMYKLKQPSCVIISRINHRSERPLLRCCVQLRSNHPVGSICYTPVNTTQKTGPPSKNVSETIKTTPRSIRTQGKAFQEEQQNKKTWEVDKVRSNAPHSHKYLASTTLAI
jgi:hypothetical protein